MRSAPAALTAAALALSGALSLAGCGADGAASGGSGGTDIASTAASSSEAPWAGRTQVDAVARAVEEGSGAQMTVLDVYSRAEYRDAMERHLATVYGDDVALSQARDASQACVDANRAAAQSEAESGARGLAGAGSARGQSSTDTVGYVNLTVTDFPDVEAARRSWDRHAQVRADCAGQTGWLGVVDARGADWPGGEAVVYEKRIPGPDGAEVRMSTAHVLDGRRQYVLNRRLDASEAGTTGGGDDIGILHRVAAALPAG